MNNATMKLLTETAILSVNIELRQESYGRMQPSIVINPIARPGPRCARSDRTGVWVRCRNALIQQLRAKNYVCDIR